MTDARIRVPTAAAPPTIAIPMYPSGNPPFSVIRTVSRFKESYLELPLCQLAVRETVLGDSQVPSRGVVLEIN